MCGRAGWRTPTMRAMSGQVSPLAGGRQTKNSRRVAGRAARGLARAREQQDREMTPAAPRSRASIDSPPSCDSRFGRDTFPGPQGARQNPHPAKPNVLEGPGVRAVTGLSD
jgi:hypothetical protein